MRHADPRQDQEPGVVSDEANVSASCFRAPADVAIAAAQVAWRRTPCQTRNRPALRPYQIFQMLSNRLLVSQVMMMLHQTVEQRFIGRPSHLLQIEGPQLPQHAGDRSRVDEYG